VPDLFRRVRQQLRRRAWRTVRRIGIARSGDRETIVNTLLALGHRGESTPAEQERLRSLTGTGAALPASTLAPSPLPPSPLPPSPAPPADATTLVVTALPGGRPRFTVGGEELNGWRPSWATLAPVLAEQLTACTVTAQARGRGVGAVELIGGTSADPAAERIARAVATALGASQ